MGKQVRILNDSATPHAYAWLAEEDPIERYSEPLCEECFEWADALVVLDTSNKQRIGKLANHLDRHAIALAIVDHHVTHDGFGAINVIEPARPSACSLVYELIRESGAAIDRRSADALYVGLSTDTGNFRYSNTDTSAHLMAAELLELGVDTQLTNLRISATAPAGRLRFFGEVLAALELLEGGKLVVIEASPEQFSRHQARGRGHRRARGHAARHRRRRSGHADLRGGADQGQDLAALRRPRGHRPDRRQLGGGGHQHAAGAQFRGSREDAKARLLPELAKLLATLDGERAGAKA